ncbi:hypothetical protein [Streptomyces sp. NPDC047061]|uniref:hypothetical protein n=1 Tax=Streptomyces sp. NPDC047061 TaxID=3154605 RepID=UPI0033D36B07
MQQPESYGYGVEDYARRLAGGLGVPDFVYQPVKIRRGGGSREISDGLLVAGSDGLIMQVKSREPSAAAADSVEKAQTWSLKNGLAGQRQAIGTRRTLVREVVRAESLRGFERDLPDAGLWPAIVIIDHPLNPKTVFPSSSDTLFISLHDWLALHSMVRSTTEVITYVQRSLASGVQVPLGGESGRYRALAEADLQASGDSLTAFPRLPHGQVSHREIEEVSLFDDLIERVADPLGATGWDPVEYLTIIEQLDRVPLIARARIGAKMRQTFLAVAADRRPKAFRAIGPGGGGNRFAFLYVYDDSRYGNDGEGFVAEVGCYTALRQHQAIDAGAELGTATTGIGVLHNPDRGRRYVFAHFSGRPPSFPSDLRRSLEKQFGNPER